MGPCLGNRRGLFEGSHVMGPTRHRQARSIWSQPRDGAFCRNSRGLFEAYHVMGPTRQTDEVYLKPTMWWGFSWEAGQCTFGPQKWSEDRGQSAASIILFQFKRKSWHFFPINVNFPFQWFKVFGGFHGKFKGGPTASNYFLFLIFRDPGFFFQ